MTNERRTAPGATVTATTATTPPRVVHLIEGSLSGGAARGAYWLHQGLRSIGVDSAVVTDSPCHVDDDRVTYTRDSVGLRRRLVNYARPHLLAAPLRLYPRRGRSLFGMVGLGERFERFPAVQAADIIHLHWVGGGTVNPYALDHLAKPIVWTLRDMWPLTGGCHYALDCDRFTNGCGRCPQLGSDRLRDLSWWMARRKRRGHPRRSVLVAISDWLAQAARRSFVTDGAEIVTIGNGINCETFHPVDREAARRSIGLDPRTKKVILAGAQNVEDFYKGFDAFLAALARLDRRSFLVAVFGTGGAKRIAQLGFEVHDLGFLSEDSALRNAYSAADVFVAPSRMEAFGKTIAEAMACGRPVVCFDATGPRDIVDHTINGYRATPFDPAALASGIEWVTMDTPRWKALGSAARAKVEAKFDVLAIARTYRELYSDILGRPENHCE